MNVVVMGCGRLGSALAVRLLGEGDRVAVIDPDAAAARRLPAGVHARFVHGSAVDRRVLEAAGIADADAFVALSQDDSANAVAARTAREQYRVPSVLACLYEPAHAALFGTLGVTTVGPVTSTVNQLLRLLHHARLAPYESFGNGETLLVRCLVPDYLAGRRAAELEVPGEIRLVELSREGRSRIPLPATVFERGDVLSVAVAAGSLERLRSFVDGRWL